MTKTAQKYSLSLWVVTLLVISLVLIIKTPVLNVFNSTITASENNPPKCKPYTNPCDPYSCDYNPAKCETKKYQIYPRYGHALDYSWVSGKLQFNPLEGGCWSIKFSEIQETADNYWGVFALQLDYPQLISKFKNDSFVVVKGKVGGQKFSMACPPNIYKVTKIEKNEASQVSLMIKKVRSNIDQILTNLVHRIKIIK